MQTVALASSTTQQMLHEAAKAASAMSPMCQKTSLLAVCRSPPAVIWMVQEWAHPLHQTRCAEQASRTTQRHSTQPASVQSETYRTWLTGAYVALLAHTASAAGLHAQPTAATRPTPSRLHSPAQVTAVWQLTARHARACTGTEIVHAHCHEPAATRTVMVLRMSSIAEAATCSSRHRPTV